jgi:hypothetical protein
MCRQKNYVIGGILLRQELTRESANQQKLAAQPAMI